MWEGFRWFRVEVDGGRKEGWRKESCVGGRLQRKSQEPAAASPQEVWLDVMRTTG
jgi:hypothetical protein